MAVTPQYQWPGHGEPTSLTGRLTEKLSLTSPAPKVVTEGTPEDVFGAVVKEHGFPLSAGISSARFWTPTDEITIKKGTDPESCTSETIDPYAKHIPRPNVDLTILRFLSAIGGPLGLDHFYANSPTTGIAKLLTLGGFGLWWIWDNLQLWLEKDRVLNYGMMPLFDVRFHDPVAQGMITDQPNSFKRTGFSLWAVLQIFFGLFGFNQIFYSKYGLWGFFFVFFVIPAILLYAYIGDVPNYSLGHKIVYGIAVAIYTTFGLGHGAMWITNATRILAEPEKLFSKEKGGGLPLDPMVDSTVNPYVASVRSEMSPYALFEGYTGKAIRDMFMIRTEKEKSDDPCVRPDSPLSVIGSILMAIFESPFASIVAGIKSLFKSFFNRESSGGTSIMGHVSNAANHISKANHPSTRTAPSTAHPTPENTEAAGSMSGGGVTDSLSTESMVLGGTLIALMLGGLIKGSVDHFVSA